MFGIGRPENEKILLDELDELMEKWAEPKHKPFDLDGFAVTYAFNSVWSVLAGERMSQDRAQEFYQQSQV